MFSGKLGRRGIVADALRLQTIQNTTTSVSASSAPAAGAVTGSGSATQLAFWDSSTNITGDAGLTYDSANDRLTISGSVGIGTTADNTATLHAYKAAAINRWIIDADNNYGRLISWRTANVQRWAIRVDGNETGANAGADFALRRYDDAGAYVASPITAVRSTGNVTVQGQSLFAASGDLLTVTANAITDTPITAQGAVGQTANLYEALDSSGNVVSTIGPTGAANLYGTLAAYSATRFANGPTFTMVRVNGSIGAESAVLSGESIASVVWRSWASGTFPAYTSTGVAALTAIATENHGTNFGTYVRLTTTPTGSATAAVRFIISANGNTIVGTTTEAGTNAVRVLAIHNSVAPTTSPADTVQFSAVDVDGAGSRALAIRDELGNVTEIGKWLKTPGGRRVAVATKATNYTLTSTDDTVVFTATATATLPAAVGNGQTYRLICRAGTLTIDGAGSDTIKGELVQTITAGEDLILTDTATGIWE